MRGHHPDPRGARLLAEVAVQTLGVLGQLRTVEASHIGSLFGPSSAFGSDAQNVLAGLVGTEVRESWGTGLGTFGRGPSGGGSDPQSIGVGDLRRIGGVGPRGGAPAPGLTDLRPDQHPTIAPEPTGPTILVGKDGLDKALIRRVIHQHIKEVKFCYERELQRNADLYGRVMSRFTIASNGRVLGAAIEKSTINNPAVESCIARAVERWEFPRPSSGGLVVVSYPFVLRAAGM
jgi:TonB family protein